MSVVSVTRWQDVANDLEPQLTIDRQKILDEGVPITSTAAERIADALQARFAISVAGTSVNNMTGATGKTSAATTSATDAAGVTTATSSGSTSSENQSSDSATHKTPDTPALPDALSTTAPTLPGTRMTPSAVDAVTRATNAASVIQSIVEINRSIRDAVRRTGYEPYLVRLQFGVQPRRREQPFDTTIRVAFLPSHDSVDDLDQQDATDLTRDGQLGQLGPLLSSSHSFGVTAAAGDPAGIPPLVTQYAAAKAEFGRVRDEQAYVSGMIEDAYHYRIRIVHEDKTASLIKVSKVCFFPMIAQYLTENEQGEGDATPSVAQAARSYALLSNAARFATGFYQQISLKADPNCKDPGYRAAWLAINKKLRLRVPRVVTLVQTDNIEGTREYFAAEQLRQVALTLSAFAGPAAGSAGVSKTLDRINDYEATRLNSIYTISQLAANTIQVRLGAARFGTRYEMVPRTVQATLLLLVPREQAGDTLDLVARPSFNNAETGATLLLTSPRTLQEKHQVRAGMIDEYCYATGKSLSETVRATCRSWLTRLIPDHVEQADWEAFNTRLVAFNATASEFAICERDKVKDRMCVAELWAELQREASRLRVMPFASMQLPAVTARNLPPMQTALMTAKDNAISVSIAGIDPWLKPGLRASLAPDCRAGAQRGSEGVSVMASDLTLSGDVGTFKFTAVKDIKPKQLCLWIDDPTFTPTAFAGVDGFSSRNPEPYPLGEVAGDAPAGDTPFKFASDDHQAAIASDGTASVRVTISDFDPKQIDSVLIAANGSIVSVDPNTIVPDKFHVTVKGDGGLTLSLRGLDVKEHVKVTAQGRKGKAKVGKEHTIDLPPRLVKAKGATP